ncbi:hypothetical protein LB504_004679 [Fusarium proliferatum]|nr:hypothetical protein LB504_004679 [Fusarium proliferatum]
MSVKGWGQSARILLPLVGILVVISSLCHAFFRNQTLSLGRRCVSEQGDRQELRASDWLTCERALLQEKTCLERFVITTFTLKLE